jgi:hypothetical protein
VTAPQPDCDCGHASDRHDYNAVTGMRPCDDCGCPTWEPRRGGETAPEPDALDVLRSAAQGDLDLSRIRWAARVVVARLDAPVYVCAGCGAIVDAARVGPSKLSRPHLAFDGECAGCTIYCPRVVRVGGVA